MSCKDDCFDKAIEICGSGEVIVHQVNIFSQFYVDDENKLVLRYKKIMHFQCI
jgi:hypothetical protein